MRNDRIRFIKKHCFDFYKGNIQKQYKRNGDLIYKENYTNKLVSSSRYSDYESGEGSWNYQNGILYYLSRNGEGSDPDTLDLYSLIRIDVDNDGYLFASIPYNIEEDISFEINNRGVFIINEN